MPRYVYPPRPKGKMNPADLPREEARGIWLAQYKFKGTRNLIHISGGEVVLYNRHGELHKKFQLTAGLRAEILGLNIDPSLEYVLDGELMDHFTKELKGTIILYDLLWAGKYLIGVNQVRRLEHLNQICRHPTILEPEGRALAVTPHLWLAQTFLSGFSEHWSRAAARPELEGLVLRKMDAKLDNMGGAEYETTAMLRCRKTEKHGIF